MAESLNASFSNASCWLFVVIDRSNDIFSTSFAVAGGPSDSLRKPTSGSGSGGIAGDGKMDEVHESRESARHCCCCSCRCCRWYCGGDCGGESGDVGCRCCRSLSPSSAASSMRHGVVDWRRDDGPGDPGDMAVVLVPAVMVEKAVPPLLDRQSTDDDVSDSEGAVLVSDSRRDERRRRG